MTSAEEEAIYATIKEMGYVLVKPRRMFPSLYRLADETIIKIDVIINHLISDPQQPGGFSINNTNIISSFVPRYKRKPDAFVSIVPTDLNTGIIDEDVEFDVLQENFSVYELSNKFVMSVKPVLAQVKKTKFYSPLGEPIYTMNINPVMKVKRA
jgi:hypothetical protein